MFMGCMEIDEVAISTVQQVKLLGVITDSKLNFDEHLRSLCLKLTEMLVPSPRLLMSLPNHNVNSL